MSIDTNGLIKMETQDKGLRRFYGDQTVKVYIPGYESNLGLATFFV